MPTNDQICLAFIKHIQEPDSPDVNATLEDILMRAYHDCTMTNHGIYVEANFIDMISKPIQDAVITAKDFVLNRNGNEAMDVEANQMDQLTFMFENVKTREREQMDNAKLQLKFDQLLYQSTQYAKTLEAQSRSSLICRNAQ